MPRAVIAGGTEPALGADHRAVVTGLDAATTRDLRTAYQWPGIFFARALQIHGRGLSANNLGNLITASSIEALPATHLFELW